MIVGFPIIRAFSFDKGPFNVNSSVADFISSGKWILSKLKECVSDQSVSKISAIPISRTNANDRLV